MNLELNKNVPSLRAFKRVLHKFKLKNARLNFSAIISLVKSMPIAGNRSAQELLWNAKGLADIWRELGNGRGEGVELISNCLGVLDRDESGKDEIGEVVLDRVNRVKLG